MTPGVQNIEPAAYLPTPPSASTSDAKAGAEDRRTSDKQGEPQSFQSELARQDSAAQASKPAGRPETAAVKPGSAKSGSSKSDSAKPGKKQDANADDSNPSAVTPAQVAQPKKQTLPLALAMGKPEDLPGEPAQPDQQDPNCPGGTKSTELLPAAPDFTKSPVLPLAADVPVSSGDQAPASDRSGASSENPPASQSGLKFPDAAPPEPTAAAVQETADSAASSPSALAFAARLTAVPPKADPSAPENPSQPPAAASSSAPARIPVRYAATAQILQDSGAGTRQQGEGPKPDAGAAFVRTDTVSPRFEAASQAPSSSAPPAPQEPVPTARLERVIEPPAAPPTSANDIRVRVPDNNGGSTQVRFLESGGEVRVSVRSADEVLAQNLRTHLNELTQRLAEGGLPAEIWKPGASGSSSSQNNPQQPDREGRGSNGQQSGGQGGQQDRQEKRPAWLDEMEASLQEK